MAETAMDSGRSLHLHTHEEEEGEEEVEVDSEVDQPPTFLACIQSDSVLQHEDEEMEEEGMPLRLKIDGDPRPFLQRSQSDAILLSSTMEEQEYDYEDDDDDFPSRLSEAVNGSRNVSECNRVYMDLSRAELFERVEFTENSVSVCRSSSGRQLETIPQDEELQTGDLSDLYASRRSLSDSCYCSGLDDLGQGHDALEENGDSPAWDLEDLDVDAGPEEYRQYLRQKVRGLQMGSVPEQVQALEEMSELMTRAWSRDEVVARDLCDVLREEEVLEVLVGHGTTPVAHSPLLPASARLLQLALSARNRDHVAACGLEAILKMAKESLTDGQLCTTAVAILSWLLKTKEETCVRVVRQGGVEILLRCCSCCRQPDTVRYCSLALCHLALYGGTGCHLHMVQHKVPEWLFPLAFSDDSDTRYHACLTAAILASSGQWERRVLQCDTMDLISVFLRHHDPLQWAPSCYIQHSQGRSLDWLKRVVPLLTTGREEGRALAAFIMVMEAQIKLEQGTEEVLQEAGAVVSLKRLAGTPCMATASRLARQALAILGQPLPRTLSQQVPLWTTEDVVHWLTYAGFEECTDQFRACRVDGDLLLKLTDSELQHSLRMGCALARKRFQRELTNLKTTSCFTTCDPTGLHSWLSSLGPDLSQYTYQMLCAGVDTETLCSLNDDHLATDCGITSGIHRMKILDKIHDLRSRVSELSESSHNHGNRATPMKGRKPIDIFICYRRPHSSLLASVIKVHLQLRGFTTHIEGEQAEMARQTACSEAGEVSAVERIRQSAVFVLVLSLALWTLAWLRRLVLTACIGRSRQLYRVV